MRTTAIIALSLLAPVLFPATGAAQRQGVAPPVIERRLAASADASVRVYNLVGRTRVVGWKRDSIVVRASVPDGAGRFFMGGSARAIKLGIEAPDDLMDRPGASFELQVPVGARVWIKSGSADIEVSAVEGELDLSSVSGRIRVQGSPRQVTAESMEGDVELATRAPLTRVKTAGGDITLRGALGSVTVSSVSGAVRITGGHRVILARLESVSGAVHFEGTLMRGALVEAQTHDGPIELVLPAGIEADFDVGTFEGTLTSRFGPDTTRRRPGTRPVEFSTGAGGTQITVRTFGGDVVLRPILRSKP